MLFSHPRFADLNKKGLRLNIAGNRLSVLARSGISQKAVDVFVKAVVEAFLREGVFIEEVRSGGQTGVDEAGIHAAQDLSLSCSILCPKGYRFSLADGAERSGKEEFSQRFMASCDKVSKYDLLESQLRSLLEGESDEVARMANSAALIHQAFGFWWTGFYRVMPSASGPVSGPVSGLASSPVSGPATETSSGASCELVLGPFQGPVACMHIPFGRGVCGTAWKERRTIVVPDVEQFPGHIACSSESRSEIVVPVWRGDSIVGVLDIDSRELSTFDEVDAARLERLVQLI